MRIRANRLAYGLIRTMFPAPPSGWLHSRWHWYRFPFSLRNSVLWSPFLGAWFSPEDESAIECMMRLDQYEPIDWVKPSSGDVFLDVGAYIGPYSILAKHLVGVSGRVIAMEPDPVNRRQLARNLALNEMENCEIIPFAAWSHDGVVGWSHRQEPVWHGIDVNQTAGTVETRSIDRVVSEAKVDRVDWIKMDIEGGEVEAIAGARDTLARFRPALFIEIHETLAPLRSLLASLNYRIEREQFDQPPDLHGWILARAQ